MARKLGKRSFIKSGESILATYNAVDLADGTGNATYYVTRMENDAGEYWQLVPSLISSSGLAADNEIRDTDGNVSVDLTPFNTPRTARGTAVIHGFMGAFASASCSVTVQFFKVSNGVETSFSSAVESATLAKSIGEKWTWSVPLTQMNFKIGDNLRVKVLCDSGAGNASVYTDSAATNTTFTITFPYRIEL